MELRVLNLGDSYSVGYGIDQDRFLGPLLESKWRDELTNHKVTVMNAEVSDPAYGLLFLQRFGLDYHPRFVFYSLCDNDLRQTHLTFSARIIFSLDSKATVLTHPIKPSIAQERLRATLEEASLYLYPRGNNSFDSPINMGLRLLRNPWQLFNASLGEFRIVHWLLGLRPIESRGDELKAELRKTLEDRHSSGQLRLTGFGSNWGAYTRKPWIRLPNRIRPCFPFSRHTISVPAGRMRSLF